MALGKGAIVLGGLGLLGLLALSGTASASTEGGGGGGGGGGGTGDDCFDASLPSDMKAQIQQMLSSKTITPTDLEAAALAAESGGFPKTAACLRKKAQEKRTAAEMEVAAKGGMPFKIRYGDIPYGLATYYTGDGARFKELRPLNPQIGDMKTINGVSNYSNWKPGLDILIPAAWKPLDKPIPPPSGGGGGGPKPAPGTQSGAGQTATPPLKEEEIHPGWLDILDDIWTTPEEHEAEQAEGGQSVPDGNEGGQSFP